MEEYKTPYYIVYEEKPGVDIIMAFKANALWRTFDVFREYGIESTASSVNEMLLANDELKCRTHTYCPAYTDETIDTYIAGSSHITFNSIEQYQRFAERINKHNADWPGEQVSPGLRVNPMCSVIETDIYNPCCPGSRFGVLASDLDELPEGIEGFHGPKAAIRQVPAAPQVAQYGRWSPDDTRGL